VDFPEEGGYTVDGYAPNEEITYETHPANNGPTYPLAVPEEEYHVDIYLDQERRENSILGI